MTTATQTEASSTQILERMEELKKRREKLRAELVEGQTKQAPVVPEPAIKKLMGVFYNKADAPPLILRPVNTQEIESELDSVDESLDRLAPLLEEAKVNEQNAKRNELLPKYSQAVRRLSDAIEAAVKANAVVAAIESEMGEKNSLIWYALNETVMHSSQSLYEFRVCVKASGFIETIKD